MKWPRWWVNTYNAVSLLGSQSACTYSGVAYLNYLGILAHRHKYDWILAMYWKMQGKKKQEADLRSIKIFPLAWSIIPDRVTRQIQSQSSRYMPSLVLSLSIICYLVNCSLPFVVFTLWRSKGLGGFVKGQKKCRRLEI